MDNTQYIEVSLDRALELTGFGKYNYFLISTTWLSLLAAIMDMTCMSIIIPVSNCDMALTMTEKSFLTAVPTLGCILMSYPWGYLSDTKGRKPSLLVAMSLGFVFSFASSFAADMHTMAILKLLSVGFSSAANSVSYAMLGEFHIEEKRDKLLMLLTSASMVPSAIMAVLAIPLLNYLHFEYDLDCLDITFKPWRLFIIVLSLFSLVTAVLLLFTSETPKFLLLHGRRQQALEVLRTMYAVNTGKDKRDYQVQSLRIEEKSSVHYETFLKNLSIQTIPLFRGTLLIYTSLLSYLMFWISFISSSYFMWLPMIVIKFLDGINNGGDLNINICKIITLVPINTNYSYLDDSDVEECVDTIEVNVSLILIVISLLGFLLNLVFAYVINKFGKKYCTIGILTYSCLSGVMVIVICEVVSGFVAFFGVLMICLSVGSLTSYAVDLYPTNLRGMAVCLIVMMSRIGGMCGIYIVGSIFEVYCTEAFIFCTAAIFVCVLVSFLLPADRYTSKH